MAEPVYIVKPTARDALVIFGFPALAWLGIAMWLTWKQMNADHPQLHALLRLLPSIAEFVGVWMLLYKFYKTTPAQLAALATAGVFGVAYGGDVLLLGADQIWSLGAGALGAFIGYSVGHSVSKEATEESES